MANSKLVNGDMLSRAIRNIGAKTDARYVKKETVTAAVLPCVSEDDLEIEGNENLTEYWIYDDEDTTGYPYYYDLPVTGITASDIAYASVQPASQAAAQACGLCASNDTRAGCIRFFAVNVPSAEIAINFWILRL